jgi:hypothetical protein
MSDQQVVLAIFKDEAAADAAVEALKEWDTTYAEIRLDAIGVLVLDEHGKIKTHKVGKGSSGKGAAIGLVLAAMTPPTLIAGLAIGGILGKLHHKSLGLSAADRDRIGAELADGKAAVGVLATADQARAIASVLKDAGGTPEVHTVDAAALDEATAAAADEG